jgi:hypothetical protein
VLSMYRRFSAANSGSLYRVRSRSINSLAIISRADHQTGLRGYYTDPSNICSIRTDFPLPGLPPTTTN